MSRFVGWLYFLQEGPGGPIKIGWTTGGPEARRRAQQIGNSNELTLIGAVRAQIYADHDWQQRFRHLRKRSEWFWPEPELLTAIAAALDAPPRTSAPGGVDVLEWMERAGIDETGLTQLLGRARSYTRAMLTGNARISIPVATKLESVSGGAVRAAELAWRHLPKRRKA